jgi:hypothetical protein
MQIMILEKDLSRKKNKYRKSVIGNTRHHNILLINRITHLHLIYLPEYTFKNQALQDAPLQMLKYKLSLCCMKLLANSNTAGAVWKLILRGLEFKL